MSLPVLFLLVVLLVVGWRWQLKRDVDRQMATLREQGVPLNGKELDEFYPDVPEHENAALIMTQAFAMTIEYPDHRAGEVRNFKAQRHLSELDEAERTLWESYFQMNRPALDRMRDALMLSKARYPVDLTAVYEAELPHLSALKTLGLLLRYDVLRSAQAGDFKKAASSTANLFGLARTLDSEPVIISAMVRVALLRMGISSLEVTLSAHQSDLGTLEELLGEIRSSHNTNVLTRALMGEIGMYIQAFRMSAAELQRQTQAGMPSGGPVGGPTHPMLRITGFMDRDLRFYLNAMSTQIELSCQGPPANLDAMEAQQEMYALARRRYCVLSSMLLPAYSGVFAQNAKAEASLDCAEVAVVIEMFRLDTGSLPDDLNDLVPLYLSAVPSDPFDGGPLRYRILEEGYMIYSIGRDGEDNGGLQPPSRIKSTDTNSYDITFTVER